MLRALPKEFRNGLVHEGRIKLAAEFSFDIEETLARVEDVWVINPERLVEELRTSLHRVAESDGIVARIRAVLQDDLATELENT
jgi:hypothetical protein